MIREMVEDEIWVRRITEHAAAREIGMPTTTLHDLLSGKSQEDNISVGSAIKIARWLGLTLDEMYGLAPLRPPQADRIQRIQTAKALIRDFAFGPNASERMTRPRGRPRKNAARELPPDGGGTAKNLLPEPVGGWPDDGRRDDEKP